MTRYDILGPFVVIFAASSRVTVKAIVALQPANVSSDLVITRLENPHFTQDVLHPNRLAGTLLGILGGKSRKDVWDAFRKQRI